MQQCKVKIKKKHVCALWLDLLVLRFGKTSGVSGAPFVVSDCTFWCFVCALWLDLLVLFLAKPLVSLVLRLWSLIVLSGASVCALWVYFLVLQRAQTKHQKVQSETTNGAPERPEVLPKKAPASPIREHKRSTRKYTQRAQTEHQRDQRFSQNGAPESPIREHKWSTRKHNQRPQMEHQRDQRFCQNGAPASPIREHKWSTRKYNQRPQTEHQRDQRFCQNGAPASPIREHKWSTRRYNQRPQTEHQKISKKTVSSRDFHLQLILIGQPTQLSQYYFALQSLHKALPSTTLYYTACTKHFPVLRCFCKLCSTQ